MLHRYADGRTLGHGARKLATTGSAARANTTMRLQAAASGVASTFQTGSLPVEQQLKRDLRVDFSLEDLRGQPHSQRYDNAELGDTASTLTRHAKQQRRCKGAQVGFRRAFRVYVKVECLWNRLPQLVLELCLCQ